MKAYSPGLRERIAAASQQPGRIVGAVAAQFSVLVLFVAELLQRQRRVWTPRPLGYSWGLCAAATGRHARRIGHLAGGRRGGRRREPGHAGPGRGGAGLTAKKKSVLAAECETEWMRALRAAFVEAVQTEDFTRFKFVDETSTNLTYGRRYARVEGGRRTRTAGRT